MMIYPRDDERAIRQQRMVEDWTKSGLLQPEQRERMIPELQVDLRRTNRFLRVTLFLFGYMIVNSVVGLFAVFLDLGDAAGTVLAFVAAGGFFALAQWMIMRYRLYRFGVEEAAAIASVTFFTVGSGLFMHSNLSSLQAFLAAAGGAFILFSRFGYLYAGVAAVVFAAVIPFNFEFVASDTARRLMAGVILLVVFGICRERREDHGWEFPGDSYGVLETTAWVGLYVMTNLKLSPWLSYPDGVPQFYWATYVAISLLPAIGLFLAIRDRHRWMLDANIVMAIVTMMSNKPYLGAEQKPWDPILFGVLMIAIALGVKRWLSGGADGSRRGFIAGRLLASERERLGVAGSAAALAPGAPAPHSHPSAELGGGGRSGGAGASGKF
jgi:hypothetical protein